MVEKITKTYNKIDRIQQVLTKAITFIMIISILTSIVCLICNIDAFKFYIPFIVISALFGVAALYYVFDAIQYKLILKKWSLVVKEKIDENLG